MSHERDGAGGAELADLAAGLAHEIRNPLNGAKLHLRLLERALARLGVDDAEAADAIAVVTSEVTRLARLVDEFLEFARPAPIARRKVRLGVVCARAVDVVREAALRASVDVSIDVDGHVEIEVDAAALERALGNLLENAIDAAEPAGAGRVVLRGKTTPRRVIIEIEDDGRGIAEPQAIFRPFFSTKRMGTGLGLAVARRIVEGHDGTLDVASTRPGRTVLRVRLPHTL